MVKNTRSLTKTQLHKLSVKLAYVVNKIKEGKGGKTLVTARRRLEDKIYLLLIK